MPEPILSLVPEPGEPIDWPMILQSALGETLARLSSIPQNPVWHGEGDVLTHTRMVCEALVSDGEWRALPGRERQILFLAALLHDVGKAVCTRFEDGAWSSPHHSLTGAGTARTLLWLTFGLCGTPEKQSMRESVCQLIRSHMAPVHVQDLPMPERKVIQLSSDGAQANWFSNRLLAILARADARGRVSTDTKQLLDAIDFFAELAQEQGCLDAPYPFRSTFERYLYLSGDSRWPVPRYDASWGQIFMLSGLPGVGKDTYLHRNLPGLPVLSLDDIREELGVSPEKSQAPVVVAAKQRAMELLRNRQPFVWNATDLTAMIRKKQISLFSAYGATTRVIYLETNWEEQLRRNASRSRAVPQAAIRHMLDRLVPPLPSEAQDIEWRCV
ncbi:MAG: AAA family ATPase [Eubacteriales bacterium]|nr:AAA family ATPase [Eubacteriales bacterium]